MISNNEMLDEEIKYVVNNPLHNRRVLVEIKKSNDAYEPIWFSRLVDILSGEISKKEIGTSIDYLTDHELIIGGYGNIGNERVAYIYNLTHYGIMSSV